MMIYTFCVNTNNIVKKIFSLELTKLMFKCSKSDQPTNKPFGPFLERGDGGRSPEFLIRLEFLIKLTKLVSYLELAPRVIYPIK